MHLNNVILHFQGLIFLGNLLIMDNLYDMSILILFPNEKTTTFEYVIYCNFLELILLLDFSLTVKAAPHECVIRTSQPQA